MYNTFLLSKALLTPCCVTLPHFQCTSSTISTWTYFTGEIQVMHALSKSLQTIERTAEEHQHPNTFHFIILFSILFIQHCVYWSDVRHNTGSERRPLETRARFVFTQVRAEMFQTILNMSSWRSQDNDLILVLEPGEWNNLLMVLTNIWNEMTGGLQLHTWISASKRSRLLKTFKMFKKVWNKGLT